MGDVNKDSHNGIEKLAVLAYQDHLDFELFYYAMDT